MCQRHKRWIERGGGGAYGLKSPITIKIYLKKWDDTDSFSLKANLYPNNILETKFWLNWMKIGYDKVWMLTHLMGVGVTVYFNKAIISVV